jgi:hypothetical protein
MGGLYRHGPRHAFAQANFLSIFGRHEDFDGSLWRLFKEMLALTPSGWRFSWAPRKVPALRLSRPAYGFLRIWAFVAVAAF